MKRAVCPVLLILALAPACSGSIGESAPGGADPGNNGVTPGPGNGQSPGNSPGTNGNNPGPGVGNGNANTPPGAPSEAFPVEPGHVPMRRLTRTQYNNTIQDLLGIAGDSAGSFGLDEQDAGFYANNRAPLKDLQLEKYHEVAEGLADKAVANLPGLLKCAPGAADADCATSFVKSFGKRVYRRPLTDAEVARYGKLFDTGYAGKDLAAGISLVLTALLQSPHFLYRIEVGEGAAGPEGIPLSAYEVGTRLSFFLTNSTPDEALLAAADSGKLRTAEGIAAEAQRLIGSEKARSSITSFYEQWLGVDDILTVEKDAKAYPIFTPEVRTSMRDEIHEFVDQVTRVGDGKLETILTSTTSYLRGPLYPLYGFPMASNAGGSILKKMELPATERAGVFTLAGLMARHGHNDQSSPVGRGFLIAARVLCREVPDPPPGVDNDIPAVDPNVSTRARFEKHRVKPECAGCHDVMDPLGVAFEIYDGVGRFRAMDGNKPVDAATEIKGTKASDGPVKDALALMRKLATADETRDCFARQMFRYAIGRAEGNLDAKLLAAGKAALDGSGRVPDLMVALATAPGFRHRVNVDLR